MDRLTICATSRWLSHRERAKGEKVGSQLLDLFVGHGLGRVIVDGGEFGHAVAGLELLGVT